MPKDFIKRHLPHPEHVKARRGMRVFDRLLHEPNLWHLNRRSVSSACAIGLFCAFLPVPSQMLLATVLCIWWGCNLAVALALVWVTNPLTMPAVFYAMYRLGCWILAVPALPITFDLSWGWMQSTLSQIWQPLLVGCMTTSVLASTSAYFIVRWLWRLMAVRRWQQRPHRHERRAAPRGPGEKPDPCRRRMPHRG